MERTLPYSRPVGDLIAAPGRPKFFDRRIRKLWTPTETRCRRAAGAGACYVAFTILTGMRDRAIASLKLKHIDLSEAETLQEVALPWGVRSSTQAGALTRDAVPC